MTRWLSESEQRTWRAFVEMNHHVMAAIEGQLMRDSQMPAAYYAILVSLSEAPDRRLRMSALAEKVEGTQSRLSHAVNRLVERGWVERQRCPNDGRGWNAWLTDDGLAALVAAAPGHVDCVRRCVLDALDERQQEELHSIASGLVEHLRSLAPEPAQDC